MNFIYSGGFSPSSGNRMATEIEFFRCIYGCDPMIVIDPHALQILEACEASPDRLVNRLTINPDGHYFFCGVRMFVRCELDKGQCMLLDPNTFQPEKLVENTVEAQ